MIFFKVNLIADTDPKSILCYAFKFGSCTKSDCLFSHDRKILLKFLGKKIGIILLIVVTKILLKFYRGNEKPILT